MYTMINVLYSSNTVGIIWFLFGSEMKCSTCVSWFSDGFISSQLFIS